MNFLKIFYWNYQSKLYHLVNKTIHNLNSSQCENSWFILLSCNIKIMELSKNTKMDEDCYIVDDSELNKNNNITVSNTAFEATSATSDHANNCSSGDVSNVCSCRGRSYKESTSINLTNRQNVGPYVPTNYRTTNPNLVLNPISICHFINWHSFYQSRGLAQLNIPPVYNEQRFDYSTQRFRNASLFSERETVSFGTPSEQGATRNYVDWTVKDKDIISELRMWFPMNEIIESKPGVHFTLMSYNVLAQDLLVEHQYLYRKHHPRALLWENRWKNLYQEILEHNPDILCLQEVQEDHLRNYFSQFLVKGYAHLYKKKTGMRTDGCAIYYKKSVFKLLENTTVEFNQEYSVLDRDNVAIIAKFASVQNPKADIVISTTHLLYNPRREDVRLAQTQVLLSEVDRIAYKGEGKNVYSPIIITGDFNSEPGSAVHRLMVNGSLQYDILTNRTLKETNSTEKLEGKILIPSSLRITDNCQHLDLLNRRSTGINLTRAEEVMLIGLRHSKRQKPREVEHYNEDVTTFSTGVLSHGLNLQSAFLHRTHNDTEGTTFQDQWITVDYIFYSGAFNKVLNKVSDEKLKLISRYSIPKTTDLSTKVRCIPNFALGSDHLALLAKFKLEY